MLPAYPAPETNLGAVARGAAGDEDRFSLSRTGPMMQRCTFLVPTGSTATHRHVPKCQVLGCVIPALLFDTSDAAMEDHLRDSNILIHDVDEAVLNPYINALACSGHFEKPLDSWPELSRLAAADKAAAAVAARTISNPALLTPREDFSRHVTCPAELEFLSHISWLDLYVLGRRLDGERPAALLGFTILLLGSRGRRELREDAASPLRSAAALLAHYVSEWAHLPDHATSALLAQKARTYLAAVHQAMPIELTSTVADAASISDDLRDAHVLLAGRETEITAVLWRRVHTSLHRFAVLMRTARVLL